MKQQRQNQLDSNENVKSQIQVFSPCSEESISNKPDQSQTKTLKQLEPSLRKSYYNYVHGSSSLLRKLGACINRVAYFLEGLWQELIPACFKGRSSIEVEESSSEFYENLRSNRKIIEEGSLMYGLDICRRKNTPFIIVVYEKQQGIFELPWYIQYKIKKYLMVPISNSKTKELQFLQLSPSLNVTLHLCRFNSVGQIVRFCQTEGSVNQDQFELWMSLGQIQINDYAEFEQRTINEIEDAKEI